MARKDDIVFKREGKGAGAVMRQKEKEKARNVEMMLDSLTGTNDMGEDGPPPDEWYKAIQQLYDRKNIDLITELSENDIRMLIRMRQFYNWSDKKLPIVKSVMEEFKSLRVSKLRKGRLELVDTFRQKMQEMRDERGMMARMFGGRRGGPDGRI